MDQYKAEILIFVYFMIMMKYEYQCYRSMIPIKNVNILPSPTIYTIYLYKLLFKLSMLSICAFYIVLIVMLL